MHLENREAEGASRDSELKGTEGFFLKRIHFFISSVFPGDTKTVESKKIEAEMPLEGSFCIGW